MNPLKKHLFFILCGAVILLALEAFFYWPIATSRASLATQLDERAKKGAEVKGLLTVPIKIPESPSTTGVITPDVIARKQAVMAWIKKHGDDVAHEAALGNMHGRMNPQDVPLLGGEPQPYYLPKTDMNRANPHDFRAAYEKLVTSLFLQQLQAGMPPTSTEVTQAKDADARRRLDNAPRARTGVPLDPSLTATNAQADLAFVRNYVSQRARGIHIYASANSFQCRPWPLGTAPTETQMFEALLDCWVMQDLVHAIVAVNDTAAAQDALKKGTSPLPYSVETSPIKRLGPIVIGATASAFTMPFGFTATDRPPSGAGDLFLRPPFPAVAAGPAAAGPLPPLDYAKSMTGRVGSEHFDVTHVRLLLDIDPSYLNQFIKELYRQNNSYTVLNVRLSAVDPFDAASNGYLYGPVPVVQADLLIEALFFHDWTQKIMPVPTRPGT